VKILSPGIAQHFTDEVDWVLGLAVGIQLSLFNDDCCTNHAACSQYVKLQVFMRFWGHQGGCSSQILLQVFEAHLCLLSQLELGLFF
jgi:hypothetical protein